MKPLAVWIDDFSMASLPGVDRALTELPATVMRSFGRVPNPNMVAHFATHRRVALIGGREANELLRRTDGEEGVLRGPGVVDVLPAMTVKAAKRISLMADVPIVTSGQRTPRETPLKAQQPLPKSPGALTPAPWVGSEEAGAYAPSERPPVAVASSTGGAWVLADVLRAADRKRIGPVLVAQHMESEFVPFFAQWLTSSTGWRTVLVAGRTRLEPATVYLPTGGADLCVDADGSCAFPESPSSRFVPCADRLFQTFAQAFGPHGIGVVLSGMGSDGARGMAELVRRGGRGLCQAPASATVPSMPESALAAARGAVSVPPELLAAMLA